MVILQKLQKSSLKWMIFPRYFQQNKAFFHVFRDYAGFTLAFLNLNNL